MHQQVEPDATTKLKVESTQIKQSSFQFGITGMLNV